MGLSWFRVFVLGLFAAGLYVLLAPSNSTEDTIDYSVLPPWPIFRALTYFIHKLDALRLKLVPPVFTVLEEGFSIIYFSATYTATKLNIPDILHECGPLPISEIAKKTGADPRQIFRILRLLQTKGMFRQLPAPNGDTAFENLIFENTPTSDILRADHPWSLKPMYQHIHEDVLPSQKYLIDAVIDPSVDPIAKAWGVPIWEFFQQNPSQSKQFDGAMVATDGLGTPAVVQDYPWDKKCSKIIDVGGRVGTLTAAILQAYPSLTGVVLDLPAPIESAKELWSTKWAHLQSRVSIVEGDFFNSDTIPSDGDCYVMKFILHDWNDDNSIAILKALVASMPVGARILEIGFHQHEPETMLTRGLIDINMMTIKGRERSVSDFKRDILPHVPGLVYSNFIETRSPLGIVEFIKTN